MSEQLRELERAVKAKRRESDKPPQLNGLGAAAEDPTQPKRPRENLTDAGNARRFAAQHSDRHRFVPPWRSWLVWDGQRWQRDRDGAAMRAAKQTTASIYGEAALAPDEKTRKRIAAHAHASESEARLRAMLSLAQSEPGMAVLPEVLDAHPDLLSVANGTLDLRTGELLAPDPAHLLTRGTGVRFDSDATCPRWEQFQLEVFDDDAELIEWAQRMVGYSLTGHTIEHVLPVCYGPGGNGKSVMLGALGKLVGDLGATASFETFMRGRGDRGPRNDLARLDRARLVVASESNAGGRLDEAAVKQLTGGDPIVARFLYGEHFEFVPEFKLWLVTNHRPRVDGGDDAVWRRLRLIPFEVSFKGREDRKLADKLEAELPGILNWALEGCLRWREHGLGTSQAVESATSDYRADEDVLGAFMAEHCELDGEVAATELRAAYEAYCEELGERPLAGNTLGRELAKRGISRTGAGRRAYRGLRLR